MQHSKRIQRILRKLDNLEDIVKYYTNGNHQLSSDFRDIRELIDELAMDKKEDHARLARKLKGFWKSKENS